MGDAQSQHEIRPRPRIGPARARRRRPASRRTEIAAATGLVLVGAATIAAIVLISPAWQRIFVAWRASALARVAHPSLGDLADLLPSAIRPERLDARPATVGSLAIAPRPAPELVPSRSVQAARPAPSSDTTQVMASLLVSQLGQDPAWRTAVANAGAHAADSPEYAYWRDVAAAIRDGVHRTRP